MQITSAVPLPVTVLFLKYHENTMTAYPLHLLCNAFSHAVRTEYEDIIVRTSILLEHINRPAFVEMSCIELSLFNQIVKLEDTTQFVQEPAFWHATMQSRPNVTFRIIFKN
jgi:hypothetical protein